VARPPAGLPGHDRAAPLQRHEHLFLEGCRLPIDGQAYTDCICKACVFTYAGGEGALEDSELVDCTFELIGPAANGLSFLADLYRQGWALQCLVEGFIDGIRNGRDFGAQA
jgi:hypothetical protein